MRRSSKRILASAATLALGYGLLGLARTAAQEAQGTPDRTTTPPGQETPQTQPAAAPTPASAPEPAATTSPSGDTGKEQPAQGERPAPARKPARRRAASGTPNTAPPRPLKLVGDHWTPYSPPDPESFPKDATLHVITARDTLWGLADLTFGNPYLWPQIWNENRYILDSHWIYPGDPLLLPARPIVVTEAVPAAERPQAEAQQAERPTVPGEVVPVGAPGAPETPASPPRTRPQPSGTAETQEQTPQPVQQAMAAAPASAAPAPAAPAPAPAAESAPMPRLIQEDESAHAARVVPKLIGLTDDTDARCSGFIAARDSKADLFVGDQEEDGKYGMVEGDLLYINAGKDAARVQPGDEFSAVIREGEVRHPITHKFLGYYYKRVGSVKVLSVQDRTSIAVITVACDEIRTGYDLVPLKVITERGRPAPPLNHLMMAGNSGKPTGYVVHVLDNIERVGSGHIVDIDLGSDDGLNPGDFLTAYMPNEPFPSQRVLHYDYMYANRRMQSPELRHDDSIDYPARIAGQMVVVSTEKHTATVKIIQSFREIRVGTQVEVR